MKTKYLLSILLLTGVLSARAQETLTLEQCRNLALENNKQMAAAQRCTQAARHTVKSYWANFFPNFTANGTGIHSSAKGTLSIPGGNLPTFGIDATGMPAADGGFAYFPGIDLNYKVQTVWTAGVSVEQPLFMGSRILSAYRMAKLGSDMAGINERLTASDILLQTDEAYSLLIKAQEMKKVAESYNQVLRELMSNVQSAYKHGLKANNDVLKVQVKLNESELAMRKAENAHRLASMNLCHLIGLPLLSSVSISGDYPHIGQTETTEIQDITARPEYALLEKQTELAHQQVKLQRSELLPQVGIRGSYNYLHGLKLNGENLFDKGSYSILLNVSVPIFHFGERYHKVKAAQSQLEQTRMEQADLNEKMQLELMQATNNLDEAHMEADLADRSLAQAAENRKVSRAHYDAGLETLSDLLESQALWQQAYATLVDARFRLYLSYVKFLKAQGKL